MKVFIEGFHYLKPPKFLSSLAIEEEIIRLYERLSLSPGRLELMTGIKERGFWPLGTKPSTIASSAAEPLLKQNDEIDLLIHASVCRDFLEPATASVVHQKLGLKSQCEIFDLSNACLGVLTALDLAFKLIKSGLKKKVLVVSGENSAPLLLPLIQELKNNLTLSRQDFKKYLASLTIGSAGVAMLIGSTPSEFELKGSVCRTDSSANHLCQGEGNTQELFMQTDSEALLLKGIEIAKATYDEFTSTFGEVQKIIPHQVGAIHRQKIREALGIKHIPDFSCYEQWGNTGSAALPLAFMLAQEANFFESQDQIGMLGIGSGLVTHFLQLSKS
jgi:acyl-CoA:acyl-CoA alkyltransferase